MASPFPPRFVCVILIKPINYIRILRHFLAQLVVIHTSSEQHCDGVIPSTIPVIIWPSIEMLPHSIINVDERSRFLVPFAGECYTVGHVTLPNLSWFLGSAPLPSYQSQQN